MATVMGFEFEQPRSMAVYQRTENGKATVPVKINNARSVRKLEFCKDDELSWTALKIIPEEDVVSANLPALFGGWHRLRFKITLDDGSVKEHLINKVGVGEVFITAGQSNAANWGQPRQKSVSGNTVVFDGVNWQPAVDPLPVCDGRQGSIWSLVGDELSEKLQVPVGFLCLAVGGSGVGQWNPKNYREKVKNKQLYGRFIKYVPALKPYGWRAVLWHQGETDRASRQDTYFRDLKAVVDGFRCDFGPTPWIIAIVGNHWINKDYGKGCRAAQKRIISEGIAFRGPDTDTLGKEFRLKSGKSSHFNQAGLKEHARLWVKAVITGVIQK